MYGKTFFIVCIFAVAYTGLGHADPNSGAVAVENIGKTKASLLEGILHDYSADPSMSLVSMDIVNLTDYANHSTSEAYKSLSSGQRADLARILKLNGDRFSKETLDRFDRDQQVAAGMSNQDVRDLMGVVRDINSGEGLSKSQVSTVKDLIPKIAERPEAFIGELDPLTQYASMHGQEFSSADLSFLRRASRDAAGISPDQYSALMDIVKSKGLRPLTAKETGALSAFLATAPIGALNGLDSRDALIIHQVVGHNANLFPPAAVRSFDTAYGRNQSIQTYTLWKGGKAPPPEQPKGIIIKPEAEKSPLNQDLRNRQGAMPQRPMVIPPGARGAH